MHICMDEVIAFMLALPAVRVAWTWLRAKLRLRR